MRIQIKVTVMIIVSIMPNTPVVLLFSPFSILIQPWILTKQRPLPCFVWFLGWKREGKRIREKQEEEEVKKHGLNVEVHRVIGTVNILDGCLFLCTWFQFGYYSFPPRRSRLILWFGRWEMGAANWVKLGTGWLQVLTGRIESRTGSGWETGK